MQIIINLEFSKAFDTVSHYHLLVKMRNLGIFSKLINMRRYFLTCRIMKVKIGNNYSKIQNRASSF